MTTVCVRRTMSWMGAACAAIAVALVMGAPAIAAESRRADPKPPTKPVAPVPDAKSIAAVNAASVALVKEAQAAMKEKGGGKLREKSDYFGAKPPAEITPEAVLAVIDKQINSDGRIDAYVKWQLLSGAPEKFSDELVPKALSAYRKAPEPYSHPGLEHGQMNSYLFRVGVLKKEKKDEVVKEFQPEVDRYVANNRYILAYRNSMYAHLPPNGDAMMAGLEDIFVRVRHGVQSKEIWESVAGSMQTWSVTAEAQQRNQVIQALNTLLGAVRDGRTKPYVKLGWSDDPKQGGLHWEEEMALWDKPIADMIESLRDAAKLMESTGFKDKK